MDTTITVVIVAGVFGLLNILLSERLKRATAKVQEENKNDHGHVRDELHKLRTASYDMKVSVMETRADVADVRADVSEVRETVTNLGHDVSDLKNQASAAVEAARSNGEVFRSIEGGNQHAT